MSATRWAMMVLIRYTVLYFLLNAAKQRIASSHPRSGRQTKSSMHCCVTSSIVFRFVYFRIVNSTKKLETKDPGCEIIAAQLPSTFHVASKALSSVSKLCFFCGRFYHIRGIFPARNAICYKCQKKGHFSNVCKSKSAKTTNASIFTTSLCAIHKTPDCLTHASLTALIANIEVSALYLEDSCCQCSLSYRSLVHHLRLSTIVCKNLSIPSELVLDFLKCFC